MNTESTSFVNPELQLKVFQSESPAAKEAAIFDQLPLLEELSQRFELVTGWRIDFSESLSSFQSRHANDRDQSIFGTLGISDLSEKIEAGCSARHRGYCDQLVETLDALVHTIQLDRQWFRDAGVCLNPVVQPPFDWWGLSGNSGIQNGRIANWTVSSNEKIQLFYANLSSNHCADLALTSAALLATFETASQTIGDIYEYAPVFPEVLRKTSQSEHRLERFGTIELDPITGEYQLDGFNAPSGYVLIDVDASAVIRPPADEVEGILYSGQIMAIGMNNEDIEILQSAISGQELSVGHCVKILEKSFADSAAIFLYRK